MSQSQHRPSKSSFSSFRESSIDSQDSQGRFPVASTTERRSQVMSRLYSLLRESVPALPHISTITSEEQMLDVIKSGIATINTQMQHREIVLRAKEVETEKASKRVQMKEQQLESKLREVELHRTKFLSVRQEAVGRVSEVTEYESRAELFDAELDLQAQLTTETKERLRVMQDSLRSKERRLRAEIAVFSEEKNRFTEELRLFTQQKLALEAAEAQIQKDQETATRQLDLVDRKLAELTDIKERQEKKLRQREDSLRVREAELIRREGQARDAKKDAQEQSTNTELHLTDLKKTILILESQLEEKTRMLGEFSNGKTTVERMRMELKAKEIESTEHLRIKEKELSQREKVLDALAASLEEERRCLQVEKAALVEEKASNLRANLSEDFSERVKMMREDVGSHAQRLENYAEWLVTREGELEAWKGSVLEDKECIENSAVMLDELQVEIENQRIELETERRQVKEEGKHISTAMKKVKAAMRDIEDKTRQLKSKEVMLTHSEAMLNERKISLEQFEKALDLREAALRDEERSSKEGFTFHPSRHSEYLTPRDVITPRSTEDSTVFS